MSKKRILMNIVIFFVYWSIMLFIIGSDTLTLRIRSQMGGFYFALFLCSNIGLYLEESNK